MWLKYLGLSGPNGEKQNEVREYTEEEAKMLLHIWPSHFVKASEDEIPKPKKSNKQAEPKNTK